MPPGFAPREQRRHIIQLLASLYPDRLALYVDFLRVPRFILKKATVERLGDDVLYVRMNILLKLMQDIPDACLHRAVVSAAARA